MKITIPQGKLKQGLGIVEKVSIKSLTLPILNNVLISAEKNFLSLSATDLEVGITWWGLSKIEKEGKITIPAKVLSSFITLLPNEKVELELKKNSLVISCKNYKTQILGISADDFPIIPKVSEEEFVSVSAISFCESLISVSDIATPSTARPEISGVYLSFEKDLITMAATDSFRLGEKTLKTGEGFNLKEGRSLIIPQKTAKEIINTFGDFEEDLKICFSSNQIMVEGKIKETEHPEVQLVSRVVDGEYPNYRDIIPKESSTKITLQKGEFLNQVRSAGIFSGKTGEIKLKVNKKNNSIEVSSQSGEFGEHNSSMQGEVEGKDVGISFNYRFLVDGISSIKSSEIILEFNGESSPGVIRPVGDPSFTYIIMPIKSV